MGGLWIVAQGGSNRVAVDDGETGRPTSLPLGRGGW